MTYICFQRNLKIKKKNNKKSLWYSSQTISGECMGKDNNSRSDVIYQFYMMY